MAQERKASKPKSAMDFLNALPDAETGRQSVLIDIDLISPDPNQPRSAFRPIDGRVPDSVLLKLRELADNIHEHKLFHPITVREVDGGRFMIDMGERRWRAYQLNRELGRVGYDKIEAFVESDVTAAARKIAQLAENLQRDDLTDIEIATYLKTVLDEFDELKQKHLAKVLHKSDQWISRILGLLDPRYEELVLKGHITYASVLEQFKTLPEEDQKALADQAKADGTKITTHDIRSRRKAAVPPVIPPKVSGAEALNLLQGKGAPPAVDDALAAQLQKDLDGDAIPGESYKHESVPASTTYTDGGVSDVHLPVGDTQELAANALDHQELKLKMPQLLELAKHLQELDVQVAVALPLSEMRNIIQRLGGEPTNEDMSVSLQMIDLLNKNLKKARH